MWGVQIPAENVCLTRSIRSWPRRVAQPDDGSTTTTSLPFPRAPNRLVLLNPDERSVTNTPPLEYATHSAYVSMSIARYVAS